MAKLRVIQLREALMAGNVFANSCANKIGIPLKVRSSAGGWIGSDDDEDEMPESPDGGTRPLFGGKLETRLLYGGSKELPGEVQSVSHCRISFDPLSLNPLRFVRNQNLPDRATRQFFGKARWCKAENEPEDDGEYSYDGNDNWLPDSEAWHEFARFANWRTHLRRYIGKVHRLIVQEIHRAIGDAQKTYEGTDWPLPFEEADYILQEVETVWEFKDDNPLELVRFLEKRLFDLGQISASSTEYQVKMETKGRKTRKFNSPCIRVQLRAGCELRVYAKTNRRLRFEVIQQLKSLRSKLLDDAGQWESNMEHTKIHMEIPEVLIQAKVRAASLLNTIVFPALSDMPDLRIRQASICCFLADFAKACPGTEQLRDVLSMLITNDGINPGAKGTRTPLVLDALIKRLSRKKLLKFEDGSRKYRVAPRYRWAVDQLQKNDAAWLKSIVAKRPARLR